jgi:hypothetical protein
MLSGSAMYITIVEQPVWLASVPVSPGPARRPTCKHGLATQTSPAVVGFMLSQAP